MRVHHLNCGTLCPIGQRFVNGTGSVFGFGLMVCHCLLVETEAGLVLIDTGMGLADLKEPRLRLGREFMALVRPTLDLDETAAHQVVKLGFDLADVRHIVVTHLDLDHAGGLGDFPQAKVHVFDDEVVAAMAPSGLLEKRRYRPAHFAHRPDWVRYQVRGEPWFGFPCVRELAGLPPEILLVPLIGHSRGHCGVAVKSRGAASGGADWLLHAGDAYFHHAEVEPDAGKCPPALALFQTVVEVSRKNRLLNQERLRTLGREHAREVRIFCAHDPADLEALRGLSALSSKVAA